MIKQKVLNLLLILCMVKHSQQLTGLQKAVRLIQNRRLNFQHTKDILLKNKIILHERTCYSI